MSSYEVDKVGGAVRVNKPPQDACSAGLIGDPQRKIAFAGRS
jgi:hypothetical protein